MIAGPASFLYAGLLGLVLVALSAQVVLARRRYRVRLGAGTEEGMRQAIRVQANFVEYVPFAVLLLVLTEITGMPAAAVHGAGVLLVASRVIHAAGLAGSPGRSFLVRHPSRTTSPSTNAAIRSPSCRAVGWIRSCRG